MNTNDFGQLLQGTGSVLSALLGGGGVVAGLRMPAQSGAPPVSTTTTTAGNAAGPAPAPTTSTNRRSGWRRWALLATSAALLIGGAYGAVHVWTSRPQTRTVSSQYSATFENVTQGSAASLVLKGTLSPADLDGRQLWVVAAYSGTFLPSQPCTLAGSEFTCESVHLVNRPPGQPVHIALLATAPGSSYRPTSITDRSLGVQDIRDAWLPSTGGAT